MQRYLTLVKNIRKKIPSAVIRSTFLVGFPGENRADFRMLQAFQQEAQFDWLGTFAYSREEDTAAYRCQGPLRYRLGRRVREKRKELIKNRQQQIMEERMDRFVSSCMDVLIEEKVEEEDLFLGRSYAQAPEVDGLIVVHAENLRPGDVLQCRITGRNGIDLEALPASDGS
jgi:ribosomal protein S12 methylthiotransferase